MSKKKNAKPEPPTVCLDCGTTTLGFRINWNTALSLDPMYARGLCGPCGTKADQAGATIAGWWKVREDDMARNHAAYIKDFFAMKRRMRAAKQTA